jgi:hypothetical protein
MATGKSVKKIGRKRLYTLASDKRMPGDAIYGPSTFQIP